jgi:hypothetical protein
MRFISTDSYYLWETYQFVLHSRKAKQKCSHLEFILGGEKRNLYLRVKEKRLQM